MPRLTENKIIIVIRRTRLEELIARYNTIDQARFYIEHLGADFEDYLAEDRRYHQALSLVERQMSKLGRVQVLERSFVPNFTFGREDTVVAVGQDGLVANILKYLEEQPVVAVNPDPARWDGLLLPFTAEDSGGIVRDLFKSSRRRQEISMALAEFNDGRKLYAVNDLFIGPKSHASARYLLESGSAQEVQSSSGVIVSTGLGSTGWLKSLLAGAAGLNRLRQSTADGGPRNEVPADINEGCFAWAADHLFFSVREPFPSKTSGADLICGRVDADHPLVITSQMPDNGVVFSDGLESDFLEFNSGQKVFITLADKKGYLVV